MIVGIRPGLADMPDLLQFCCAIYAGRFKAVDQFR